LFGFEHSKSYVHEAKQNVMISGKERLQKEVLKSFHFYLDGIVIFCIFDIQTLKQNTMVEQIEIELTNNELVIGEQNIYPLTELQVKKMFMLLKTEEDFKFGVLDTKLLIELENDNYSITSLPFDVWGGDNSKDDEWGDEVSHYGNLTELNKMNTYENRFIDSEDLDSNPMSISFEYEVIDGEVQEFDDDTHSGSQILSDEETKEIVEKLKSDGHISDNENGQIDVYDDMIVIERFGKEPLLIPVK
jgi:hypothetical protein